MKTLIVMRHAKSDHSAGVSSDFERPLNERGLKTAPFMGKFIKEAGFVPEILISSSANRAITTAELFAESCGYEKEVILNRDFYYGYMEEVISALRKLPENINSCMIVGHNPTWENIVSRLTGKFVIMPTASVAILKYDNNSWNNLTFKTCKLEEFYKPRDLM